MAVFILVMNWLDNIEVLMIWVSVGRMSSRPSSGREVDMGSKVQNCHVLRKALKFEVEG